MPVPWWWSIVDWNM